MASPSSERGSKRRFVVLDRDGTIMVERFRPLLAPDDVELVPGAACGLRQMSALGLGLAVITNQSCLGRGLLDGPQLELVHGRLGDLLSKNGVSLDGIYVCPHTPLDGCICRKPKSGLLEQAARELDFDAADCFVIGDKSSDIACGMTLGATTLLVRTGYGGSDRPGWDSRADYSVEGLPEAAQVIQQLLCRKDRSEASQTGR